MSLLFSLDNILLNESNDIIDIDNIECMNNSLKNYSFVQEGYNFILEMNSDYITAEKTFCEAVLGSYGNDNIINESFSGFFDKIKAIIHKFIDWIKKIFKEFSIKIHSLVSSDKYIKKNHKLLNKFDDSKDEFEFEGYEFSNINNTTIPANNALDAFSEDNDGKGYLNTWYGDSGTDEEKTNELNSNLNQKLSNLQDNMEDFYDSFRAKVINKTGESYDSSEYGEVLFKLFRSDETSPSSITVDSSLINEIYNRFDGYKETVKSIEKTQKDIIKNYQDLEKYLDKMIKLSKEGEKLKLSISDTSSIYVNKQIETLGDVNTRKSDNEIKNKSTFDIMNNYLKVQSTKINEMCQIHTRAFTAKLEAAKDCFKQDKKILYKALSKVAKRSNKSDY